jgi:xanthine dehydrogenase small subunit
MLLNVREYHRPATLDAALDLLARPNVRTTALAGGDTLVATADSQVEAVVDLQDLDLKSITAREDTLRIGALTTREALCSSLPAGWLSAYRALLASAAGHWDGSVQRNRATVGGALAVAAPNDPLVCALLACAATIFLYTREGEQAYPLHEFLPQRAALLAAPAIITGVRIARPAGQTGAALQMVGRTPADAPIVVVAAGLSVIDGRCTAVQVGCGGVAAAPVRLSAAEAQLTGRAFEAEVGAAAAQAAVVSLSPTGDFRGSAAYRLALVETLTQRALQEAWAAAQ